MADPTTSPFAPLFKNPRKPTPAEIKAAERLSSLGLFIMAFSAAEQMLWMALMAMSGLEMPMAQALLSGFKVNDGTSILNRAMDIRGVDGEERKHIADVLRQLGEINKMRQGYPFNRTSDGLGK